MLQPATSGFVLAFHRRHRRHRPPHWQFDPIRTIRGVHVRTDHRHPVPDTVAGLPVSPSRQPVHGPWYSDLPEDG